MADRLWRIFALANLLVAGDIEKRMFKRKQSDNTVVAEGKGKNWYKDRYQYVLVQRNVLVLLSIISLLASLVSAIAISQLTPHKSVQPFVVQIDDVTGEVRVVKSRSERNVTEQQMIDKSNLAKFVWSWETYNWAFRDYNNEIIWAMAAQPVYQQFFSTQKADVEGSTAALLNKNGERSVEIGNIVFLAPQLNKKGEIVNRNAQVSFRITQRDIQTGQITIFNQQAVIGYQYVDTAGRENRQMLINPLGFHVVAYEVQDVQ